MTLPPYLSYALYQVGLLVLIEPFWWVFPEEVEMLLQDLDNRIKPEFVVDKRGPFLAISVI